MKTKTLLILLGLGIAGGVAYYYWRRGQPIYRTGLIPSPADATPMYSWQGTGANRALVPNVSAQPCPPGQNRDMFSGECVENKGGAIL